MSERDEWKHKQGVEQEHAEAAERGVNKSGMENLREALMNLKEVFNPSSRGNEAKKNQQRKTGQYTR